MDKASIRLHYSFDGNEYEYECIVDWDAVDSYLSECGEEKADRELGYIPDYFDDGFVEWLTEAEEDNAREEYAMEADE